MAQDTGNGERPDAGGTEASRADAARPPGELPGTVRGRSRRMSVGGKLSFRRRAREARKVPGDARDDLPLCDGGDDPPGLEELVPVGYDEVEIEVGPGKGAFLLAATEARPRSFLIGIEAAPSYARLGAAQLAATGRRNGLFLIDNAAQFLRDRVPDGCLARLHVYFPDPWPKRRHRGRRFFDEDAARLVHRVLAPGGWLFVSTDNAAYAGQICRVLGASPLLRRDRAAEHALSGEEQGRAFTPSSFERKYLAEGRIIRHYAYRRTEADA